MSSRFIFTFFLLFISWSINAAELKTWDLKHRSAAEMIPLLKPMLEEGSSISGSGYILFVRSSRENLAQLETIISRLDTAPQMLRITVQQDIDKQRNKSGASLSGNVKEPKVQVYSTRRNSDENGTQQIQVLEGHWATIRTGQAIPHTVQRTQQGPAGSSVTQSIEYRNVESGFEVRPNLSGKTVRLDIRPFQAGPSPQDGGVIEQQEIITSVSGRPGEWIELGGIAKEQKQRGTGIIYFTQERNQRTRNIRIKVEIINP